MPKGTQKSNKEIKKPKKEKPKVPGATSTLTARMSGAMEKAKPPKK